MWLWWRPAREGDNHTGAAAISSSVVQTIDWGGEVENVPDVMLWTLKAKGLASSLSSLGRRPGVRIVSDVSDACDDEMVEDEIVEERELPESDAVDEVEKERYRWWWWWWWSGEQDEKFDKVTWEC